MYNVWQIKKILKKDIIRTVWVGKYIKFEINNKPLNSNIDSERRSV